LFFPREFASTYHIAIHFCHLHLFACCRVCHHCCGVPKAHHLCCSIGFYFSFSNWSNIINEQQDFFFECCQQALWFLLNWTWRGIWMKATRVASCIVEHEHWGFEPWNLKVCYIVVEFGNVMLPSTLNPRCCSEFLHTKNYRLGFKSQILQSLTILIFSILGN
jgi:hypothetical protein